MRIGYNLTNLSPGYMGGVRTFALDLFRALIDNNNHTFILIVRNKLADVLEDEIKLADNVEVFILEENFHLVGARIFLLKLLAIFGSIRLTKAANSLLFKGVVKKLSSMIDINYVPTATMMPFSCGAMRTISSIHDLQHVHFPHFFSKLALRYREVMYQLTADSSDIIQASSYTMLEDFSVNLRNVDRNKINVIPEGVGSDFLNSDNNMDVTRQDFIFYPAQLWPHKNHKLIIEAMHKVSKIKGEIPLVLCGKDFGELKEIKALIKKHGLEKVTYLGVVPRTKLIELYKTCKCTLSAALYESSSLPIIEALALGAPIVASNTSQNLEIKKNVSITYFDSSSSDDLADKIVKIFSCKNHVDAEKNRKFALSRDWSLIGNRYEKMFEDCYEMQKLPQPGP